MICLLFDKSCLFVLFVYWLTIYITFSVVQFRVALEFILLSNSYSTLLNWPIVSLLIIFILFSMFFVLIHDYTLCFTGFPCCNFGYYNYICIWPYYIVIHFIRHYKVAVVISWGLYIKWTVNYGCRSPGKICGDVNHYGGMESGTCRRIYRQLIPWEHDDVADNDLSHHGHPLLSHSPLLTSQSIFDDNSCWTWPTAHMTMNLSLD